MECVELCGDDGASAEHSRYIDLRGEVLPYLRLREVFGMDDGGETRRESVVVVRDGARKAGLVVDELMGELQAVIKPLGAIFARIQGVSGSTILGSGDVALILDVALIEKAIDMDREKTQERPRAGAVH